jgi:hypothetical protein
VPVRRVTKGRNRRTAQRRPRRSTGKLTQLKTALGSLDHVKQIVRLEGTMGCAPGFHDQPKVLNGASHIVNQVFGPRGRHTRMLYSNNEMPLDCATLVVLTAEIMPR